MAVERAERAVITIGKGVGLAVKDCFDEVFFGSTQKEIKGWENVLAGNITPGHRIAYRDYRLRAVGLSTEQYLVSSGLIMVYGTREIQNQEERALEQKRLERLTLEELDAEVRGDARSRLIMAYTARGKRPEDIVHILNAITTPPQKS